jgi:major membrane immunogen (membrane-anchored lipoprotein)
MTDGKYQLDYKKYADGNIQVYYTNGVFMGNLEVGDDGYYVWWDDKNNSGYVPSWILRELADKLDELNKEWDEGVKEFFR